MNTQIIFYCTQCKNGSFEKIIFKTIVNKSFDLSFTINNWLDDQISNTYNKFDLYMVFDWVIMSVIETDDKLENIHIINTIPGQLVFGIDIELLELKAKNYDLLKQLHKSRKGSIKSTVKTISIPKKEYTSAWINPFGEISYVGFADHNKFASNWLEENNKELWDKINNSFCSYHYTALEELGWIRILGWTDPPQFVLPLIINPQMKIALKDYCLSQDVPYEGFPEILKN